MKFNWEDVFYIDGPFGVSCCTWRAKVPGGWLIHNTAAINNVPSASMVFVADQNHEWEIEKE